MLELIWLIPLLPLIGVAINGLGWRRLSRRSVGLVACGVIGLTLLLSAAAVWELAGRPAQERFHEVEIGTWLPLGPIGDDGSTLRVAWGFALDPLSAVMLLVVSGVGFLIHVYSVGYMAHEPDHARFFAYMNLFMSMMLTLVLADNLLVLFVGWEGVGLCSYLLIGFFYDRPFDERSGLSCADAGRKAFLVNRIGDFAFLIGMLYLALEFGTLNLRALSGMLRDSHAPEALLAGVGILLFIGACGKSAQIPLYVWLPDAMAGPTPVSALIHAATMVTAGVYMVCRMSALYSAAPEALAIVAAVGALTALFAATMGLTATDIKKVLAYSTVSQLGYMFAAAGVGAYVAAIFHLMTHAFFKALLFLGAGSVIHGLHGEQDIRRMGGLRHKMPRTWWTFGAATLAIAGIFPFAGFFSKDEILAGAWFGGHRVVWGLLALSAVITAFYMTRLAWRVFFGGFRGDAERWSGVHESPPAMTLPLVILAVLSAIGGWIGVPAVLSGWIGGGDWNLFHRWLAPAVTAVGAHGAASEAAHAAGHAAGAESALIVVALVLALAGIGLALAVYRRPGLDERLARGSGPLYVLLRNLYWVDELYDAALVRPFYAVSRGFAAVDRWVVDGLVNGAGVTAELTGQVIKLFQTGFVRNYALTFLLGVAAILYYLIGIR
jgi:NADH-quinone oxidoreductase subunit L